MAIKVPMQGPCQYCGRTCHFTAKSKAQAARMADAVWVCSRPDCEARHSAELDAWAKAMVAADPRF